MGGARQRIFGLDIMRAAAILAVVAGHGSTLLSGPFKTFHDFFLFDGVSVFFVLSGFLIGGILIRDVESRGESVATLRHFWVRRWYRTLPNYFLILALLALVYHLWPHPPGWPLTKGELVRFGTFTENFRRPMPTNFFREAWSLSVEEWFYIGLPISVLLLSRFAFGLRKAVPVIAVTALIAATAFRAWRFHAHPPQTVHDWDGVYYKEVIMRFDSLMYGVIGAYFARYFPSRWSAVRVPALILGAGLWAFHRYLPHAPLGVYTAVIGFSVMSLATALTLPFFSQLKASDNAIVSTVTWISLISYSMYLVNYSLVLNGVIPALKLTGVAAYAVLWIATIAISSAIFVGFERPTTRLRDRKKRAPSIEIEAEKISA
ncbi:MAG TPA: acyltransferase [Opitutaceae bacterium]|jgi:peptidoglycan/LPS O-acetylase OafA/YrhL